MKNKEIILTYIATILLLSLVFFGTLLVYDPLKLFHNKGKYKNYIQDNMREQAAGIINNWDFDSIILGTSMLENTSAKETSKILEGNFVNISISGGSWYERKFLLDYALRNKEVKKVLYSLDYLGATPKGGSGKYKISNWNYLYDDNPFNDFSAYINDKYLKCLFSINSKKHCMGRKILNLDRPNSWYKSKSHLVRYGGLDNWFKAKDNSQIKGAFNQILRSTKAIKLGHVIIGDDYSNSQKVKKSENYINKNLLNSVKKNIKTEFIFILPPYSRIKYAIWAQYNKRRFELYKTSLKYIVLKSRTYKNLKVYGWGTEAFVDNIANYKDLRHYEYKINSWMLKAIKNKKGLLTEKNIDNYLNMITKKALNFNLIDIGDKIENFLYTNGK